MLWVFTLLVSFLWLCFLFCPCGCFFILIHFYILFVFFKWRFTCWKTCCQTLKHFYNVIFTCCENVVEVFESLTTSCWTMDTPLFSRHLRFTYSSNKMSKLDTIVKDYDKNIALRDCQRQAFEYLQTKLSHDRSLHDHVFWDYFWDAYRDRACNRNYSAILATLQITSYALGV